MKLATTLCLGAALLAATSAVLAAAPARPWMDRALSPARRAALLNARLTLDERIALVHGPMALPFGNRPLPPRALPSAGFIPAVPRLGIPSLRETDASLGVTNPFLARKGDGGTALPASLALAASFDPELAFETGALVGAEARAKGFNVLLGGGVNLARDPRGGRNFEYAGEDPLLAGTIAGESIRGIQSNGIISTVKHFALNDQETHRHFVNALIDEQGFRESDLLAFQLAIERGRPGSVMCAYNLVEGQYACGNDRLLNGVLKGDWAYPGFVMSDWGAVKATDFVVKGLDQQSGEQLDDQVWFGAPLKAAVQRGTVPAARLGDMTGRILHAMFSTGLMDRPVPTTTSPVDYAANTRVARRAAQEGIVLLRNERDALPLAADARRILVIGAYASRGGMSGGGSSQVFPVGPDPKSIVEMGGDGQMAAWRRMVLQGKAPLAAIKERAPQATVTWDEGRYPAIAAAKARAADVVIVIATKWMGEAEDAPDLSLPDGQDETIAQVAAANPATIVVLQTGGAVAMPWLDRTAAVLSAWYGGVGGGDALADVLFGNANPSGRLPVTFPRSVAQYPRAEIPGTDLPDRQQFDAPHVEGGDVGYRWFARTGEKPLFPFGYGLSYTAFDYKALAVTGGTTLAVAFDVTNTGRRAGADVPQVYLTDVAGQRVKRLVGFRRVTLQPGETRRVTLAVDPRLLADYDVAAHGWRVKGGRYRVAVGASADDQSLRGSADVQPASIRP